MLNNNDQYKKLTNQFEMLSNKIKKDFRNISDEFRKFSLKQFQFSDMYAKALNDPESVINHMEYGEQLNKFYWPWPYEMSGAEIKKILKGCNLEKDFDKQMQVYYTPQRTQRLFRVVYMNLPRHHKVIFRQVINSYQNYDYAIANNALMSIIDNMLQKYMANPASVRRKGVVRPMVDCYGMCTPREAPFWIRLNMLSYAIDVIFEHYNFAYKMRIDTNKKARRHPSVHGFRYSNQKIDTLFLVNTIYEINYHNKYMKPFEGTIEIPKKWDNAKICEKKVNLVKRRIRNSGIINKDEL